MRRTLSLILGALAMAGCIAGIRHFSRDTVPVVPTDAELVRDILAATESGSSPGNLSITYPMNETVFPPEIPAPTFRWQDTGGDPAVFLVQVEYEDGDSEEEPCLAHEPEWTPSDEQWERIKQRSRDKHATVTIQAANATLPVRIRSAGQVTINTSSDEVGAPIFYREVILPFSEAIKDTTRIRWRFGDISSSQTPPIVLQNLPVCGNCHSFSADASVLGMDVDYANRRASYAIAPVTTEIVLDKQKIITWDDYEKGRGKETFGLLSQVSPDGRYIVSTVKDQSVFVARPDFAFSQLFFPVQGILVVYDREARTFQALPGADDPQYVQSNPSWSPDGKYIVFARNQAYQLQRKRDSTSAVLSSEECSEFLHGDTTFKFDLYRIPFNKGRGGTPQPLQGASGNGKSNYFARYSPDGKWIVFCQAQSFMLLQPDSELYIIPSEGGTARKLSCNTARMNSWHSWSPNSKWLVFSSKATSEYTQLFLTHIDDWGHSSPPVMLSHFTTSERAANIPEFVNCSADSIKTIREQFVDDLSYVRAGADSLRFGDADKAEKRFHQALQMDPGNVEAHSNLGYILLQRGLLERARPHIMKSLASQPQDPDVNNYLTNLLILEGKYAEALAQGRKTVQLDPDFAPARLNLGIVLWQQGNESGAIEQLTEATRLAPNDPSAHYHLGIIWDGQQQLAKAAAEFELAVKCRDDFVPALLVLARIRVVAEEAPLRNPTRAVALAEKACAVVQDPVALDVLAVAYAAAGRLPDAIATAQRALPIAESAGAEDLVQQLQQRIKQLERLQASHRGDST